MRVSLQTMYLDERVHGSGVTHLTLPDQPPAALPPAAPPSQ